MCLTMKYKPSKVFPCTCQVGIVVFQISSYVDWSTTLAVKPGFHMVVNMS